MTSSNAKKANADKYTIRFIQPNSTMGIAVNQLIEKCPPLDSNSIYCNILQCYHFAHTSIAAFDHDTLIGFISAYIPPQQTDTLFIWQVAVDRIARGQGLAKKMLLALLQRESCININYLETTITHSNQASWGVFRSLAKTLNAPCHDAVLFSQNIHFNDQHGSEHLVSIGPFNTQKQFIVE